MEIITSISDIVELAQKENIDWKSYGNVSIKQKDNLLLFNYTAIAQYEARWNFFERVSRGLIINSKTGEIVARPFDRFFNWGEGERKTNAPIKKVTIKLDGSLGVLYRLNGQYKISTRGSFDSDQAIKATELLSKYNLSCIPDDLTLLFEIIYPDNRIVIDYGNLEELTLIGTRNRHTGEYIDHATLAQECKFEIAAEYKFISADSILIALHLLDGNKEGWVVEFEDGQRFKFKGKRYLELHKLISGLSFKNTLKAVENNEVENIRTTIPDEFLIEFNEWANEIETKINKIKSKIETLYHYAPTGSRKEFALWASQKDAMTKACLFAKLDNKEIKPIIINFYKKELL